MTEETNVVDFASARVTPPGDPQTPTALGPVNVDVVASLESLLARAKRGEFQGMLMALVVSERPGDYGGVGTGWSGMLGGQHLALGAIEALRIDFSVRGY